MGKCDGVENECLRYSKALGGNIKVTGSSVGELRKEQVLPKRYDMVSEYQERLRQASGMTLTFPRVFVDFAIVVSYETRATDDINESSQCTCTHPGC